MTGEYDTKSKELDKAQKEADNLRENQETFRQLIFVRPLPRDAVLPC